MTAGKQSKGVDLDSIFHLYVSGTHPPATGIKVGGVDIATRYQPLPGGTAAATGILTEGVDLNAIFATTAGTPLPIDGNTYGHTYRVTSGTGWSQIGFQIASGTTYEVFGADSATAPTAITSGAVPTGSATVQYTWGSFTIIPGAGDGGGSTFNGAASPTAISSNPAAHYTTGSFGSTSSAHNRIYTFTIDFFNSSGVNISHTTIYLSATIEGSV